MAFKQIRATIPLNGVNAQLVFLLNKLSKEKLQSHVKLQSPGFLIFFQFPTILPPPPQLHATAVSPPPRYHPHHRKPSERMASHVRQYLPWSLPSSCSCWYVSSFHPFFFPAHTVDGRYPAPVEVGSLSHYSQGSIHPKWCRISSINSMIW